MSLSRRSFLTLLGAGTVAYAARATTLYDSRDRNYWLRFVVQKTGQAHPQVFKIGEQWFDGPVRVANLRRFEIHWQESACTLWGFSIYKDPRARLLDMCAHGPFTGGPVLLNHGDSIIIG